MKGSKQDRRDNAGREGTTMLTVVSDSADRDGSGAVRSAVVGDRRMVGEGARRMLAEACGRSRAYIARFADVRDEKGHRLVVRNGYHEPREVTTRAGAVDAATPSTTGGRPKPLSGGGSLVDPAAVGAQDPADRQVLPLLYLHGLAGFVPPSGSSSAAPRGCPPRRSAHPDLEGRAAGVRRRTSRVWTSCTCGLTASMPTCASTTRSCACW
jgi:hypothetical protein